MAFKMLMAKDQEFVNLWSQGDSFALYRLLEDPQELLFMWADCTDIYHIRNENW